MDMQERINQYWSMRADEFGEARYTDMQGIKREKWAELIAEHLPDRKPVRALDLGTGGGFFAFILNDLGCQVHAVDYSEQMLKNARENAEKLNCQNIAFMQMDAQDLQFADESFDFIFSRNVTWTLPDPARAYREMVRVLKPEGILMNADANYAASFAGMDEEMLKKQAEHANPKYEHPAFGMEMLKERNDIAMSLSIAGEDRPFWDLKILAEYGMRQFWFDLDVNADIFGFPSFSGHSAEFVLCARKITAVNRQ